MPEVGVGTVTIEPDMTGFRAAMAKEAGPAVDGLTRDINGRLRDSRGKFVAESGGMGAAGGTAFATKFQAASMAGMAATFKKMRTVGRQMTMALTLPLLGVGAAALKTGATFEKSMNVLQASTKATADEMAAMSKLAMDLGDDIRLPGTSASDAAAAMLELSKAGLTVRDTMAASRGVLELAAAGQIDNATAANLTASALLAFNLQGTEATRVADLLAAGANESLASVEDMGYSMQMAGSIFAAAGIPIEDMVTSIAQLANAGISGSDAGTSLKSMLLKLQAPSEKAAGTLSELGLSLYNADGSMKDFRQIIGEMSEAMVGLTQQQKDEALATIFGSDAIRSANILIADGTAGFDAMKEKVTQAGAAQDMAAAQTKGLSGAWDAIGSALDTAAIKLTKRFLPFFTDLARNIAELIGKFTDLPAPILIGVAAFVGLAAIAGPLVYIVGALGSVFGFLLSPVGLALTGIALLAAGLYIAYQKFEWFRDIVDEVAVYLQDKLVIVVDTVLRFWHDHLFPALQTFGAFLRDDVGPALLTFGGWIRDEVLPIVDRFKGVILTALFPLLRIPILLYKAYQKFEWFRDVVDTVVQTVRDNFVPGIQTLADIFRDDVMPALSTGADIIREKVIVAFDELVRFWNVYLLPIIETVARYMVEVLWPNFQKAIGWIWRYAEPILKVLAIVILGVLYVAFKTLATLVVDYVFPAIVKIIEWAWSVIKPTLEFIKDLIANVLLPVFIFLKNVVVDFVFPLIVAVVKDAWEAMKAIFEILLGFYRSQLQPGIEALAAVVSWVFTQVANIIKDQWHGFIQPVLQAVIDFVEKKVTPIWSGIVNMARAAWGMLPGIIGGVLRTIGGLIAGFLETSADVADILGLDHVAKVLRSGAADARQWGHDTGPGATDQGQGGIAVEGGLRRARGGVIPGPNVNRDIVPVLAMPGEYFVRRSAVERFGTAFFDQLNAGQMPAYAAGGAVYDTYRPGWNTVHQGAGGGIGGGGFNIERLEVVTPAGSNVDELVGAISARLGWAHTTRRDR